jgi:RNA polymerase sigma-70 factor (ECF subfamily)
LYEQHQPDVLAYFYRRLDHEDAVEATADVFLTAWRRLDDVPSGTAARLWLFGVAHNMLSNRQRSNRRLRRLVARVGSLGRPGSELPETVVVRRAEDCEVMDALSHLRPIDREVLTLRLWEEATFTEIGQIVGCSRHAAEQRYGKALQRFRSVWSRTGHVSVSGAKLSRHGQERTREA